MFLVNRAISGFFLPQAW